MRLISWNVNARRTFVDRQVAALAEFRPDIIALQEITPTSLLPLQIALRKAGWLHIVDSFSLAPAEFTPLGPRRYGLLLASHYPLTPQSPHLFQVPWPERVLSAAVQTPNGLVDIYNTHVPPGSSNGWIKVDHLLGLFDGLAHRHPNPRILCGDFNTPQAELASGEVVTWGQRVKQNENWRIARTIRGKAGSAWDAAERRVLVGLAKYVHALRTQGLSDHSPIMANFAPKENVT